MYQQLLTINDNVFKFFTLLGLVLFVFGVVYPNDKMLEIHELKCKSKLKEQIISLKIDEAQKKLDEYEKIISSKEISNNSRDSLQAIVDSDEIEISKDFFELEYQTSVCKFAEGQLSFFTNYRLALILSGILLFLAGTIFWIIFFIKGQKSNNQ